MTKTELFFREDAYCKKLTAKVLHIDDRHIILDKTIFYATSGGQPGDNGTFTLEDGSILPIETTITGESKDDILHVAGEGKLPKIGEEITIEINWPRRYQLMKMHTACHLMTVLLPFPVTGAAVSETDSRIDFDMGENNFNKEEITEKLMQLVEQDFPVSQKWISEDELASNPSLIKSKFVRPPMGSGKIRLICIGENGAIDSQPCGGTHVLNTSEIGTIHIGKIEKKGRENRRFRLRFGAIQA